jgi:hypothetical protein
MFLKIQISLDSFQIIAHVSTLRTLSSKHIKEMCNIKFFWNKNMKNKALIIVPRVPIFVNVPPRTQIHSNANNK